MGVIFVSRSGQNLGQFTEEQISLALQKGEFLPTDLGWKDGMESWQPLSTFGGWMAGGVVAAQPAVILAPTESRLLPGKIHAGSCFRAAWSCFKNNLGICIAASLVFIVLSVIVQLPSQLAEVVMNALSENYDSGRPWLTIAAGVVFLFFMLVGSALSMVLSAGIFFFFVSALRQKPNIAELFSGFRGGRWIHLILAGILWLVIVLVIAAVLVGPAFFVTRSMDSYIPIVAGVVLAMLPILYLSVSINYAYLLIIDRDLPCTKALKQAFVTTHQQWFRAFGLLLLVGLVMMSGVILCCVGLLATLPLGYLIWAQSYRQMFGDPGADAAL